LSFEESLKRTLTNEGGYTLHTVKGDRGGMTYAGIARKFHPDWDGWSLVDNNVNPALLTPLVAKFYQTKFWDRLKCDQISSPEVAFNLFDFAVNAGVRTAVKLMQVCVESTPDGGMGPNTLKAINAVDAEELVFRYAIAKVARYAQICNRDRSQSKFLLGWLNRTLKVL